MKFLNWLIEIVKTLLGFFSVEGRDKEAIVEDLTEFLGKKTVDLKGVEKALADLGIEFGGAVIGEALGFAKKHKISLLSMSKEELVFIWGKIFSKNGEFDEEAYKNLLKSLDYEALVLEIENNARGVKQIRQRVQNKEDMIVDLKENVSTLARFALAKAISIASHGVI